ncbi:hypothetical protein ACLESD_03585 [Pyxidicoccus sp. 3LFB2]
MSDPAPRLDFSLVSVTGDGIPTKVDDSYRLMLDQAVAGGEGTSGYLNRMLQFAQFSSYLQQTGPAAFTQADGPAGTFQASATDGTTTMNVGVQLNDGLAESDYHGIPVRGVATVRMSVPEPREITKIVNFGIGLAEIPPGLAITDTLIQSLFKPLLQQLTQYVQTTIRQWLEADAGESIDELGDALANTTEEVAETVGEETAEALVEETVVAEVAVDLTAVCPAFAGLALLVAAPLIIEALEKDFQLFVEIDNLTTHDFNWAIEYQYNNGTTAQPKATVIPKMGFATDAWGDQTTVNVAYQANFSSTNKSGFEGTGFALRLSATDVDDQDIAAVISIPWIEDNALWLGDATPGMDWEAAFDDNPVSQMSVDHGNRRFYTTLAIDSLSGNQDVYHCVLRIEPL